VLVAGTPSDLQPLDQIDGSAPPATGNVPSMQSAPPLFAPPTSNDGTAQQHSGSPHHAPAPPPPKPPKPPEQPATPHVTNPVGETTAPIPALSTPGAPSSAVPGIPFPALPGPGQVTGVPNFVIQSFHVPPFLLPIYQAAGIQYGIRWEVLAAINEIETDYGRNLNVSSAGALGWMQFMPATWQQYGVDANKDGKRDPYNPVDAIFAAARYLKAAGGDKDIRTGIFAYNHAGWYVDSVMLRARLIAGYPPDLIGSLTGLTEARFPVAAHARYANDATALKHVNPGQNAANVVTSSATRRGIDIFASRGAPVVAVNDGVIKDIGRSKDKGLYVVLQDVYGNRYTYSGLGSLAQLYPVPKSDTASGPKSNFQPVGANDPKPSTSASAGTQRPGAPAPSPKPAAGHSNAAAPAPTTRITAFKQRFFAHPARPVAQRYGGADQLLAQHSGNGFETYDNYFSHALGLNSRNATLKRLNKGSQVIGSTVLGRVGGGKTPHVHFEIQPAGQGAPKIDPKPILDGWKLLESTAIYSAKGKNVLYGDGNLSIGEIMLLPKQLLVKRVLSDPRISIYAAGRNDIKTGQIDRRVLIVLEYLAESGLKPTVSCLRSGHSELTSSGNVSEHASGNAVDISAINGVSINGHQGAGGVTEQAVKRLMMLQGTIRPHQIISLLDFGQNTLALPDHADHIHVGFHPLFGANAKLGREVQSVLKPGQWDSLVQRLGQIQNPSVPTTPSRYAIPDRGTGHK
jgi:murein DD-endopeptidase MepM/ murein hydrolase activator NlpD